MSDKQSWKNLQQDCKLPYKTLRLIISDGRRYRGQVIWHITMRWCGTFEIVKDGPCNAKYEGDKWQWHNGKRKFTKRNAKQRMFGTVIEFFVSLAHSHCLRPTELIVQGILFHSQKKRNVIFNIDSLGVFLLFAQRTLKWICMNRHFNLDSIGLPTYDSNCIEHEISLVMRKYTWFV